MEEVEVEPVVNLEITTSFSIDNIPVFTWPTPSVIGLDRNETAIRKIAVDQYSLEQLECGCN